MPGLLKLGCHWRWVAFTGQTKMVRAERKKQPLGTLEGNNEHSGCEVPKLPRTDPHEIAFQVPSALQTSKDKGHGSGVHQRTRQPKFQPVSWLLPSSLVVCAPCLLEDWAEDPIIPAQARDARPHPTGFWSLGQGRSRCASVRTVIYFIIKCITSRTFQGCSANLRRRSA